MTPPGRPSSTVTASASDGSGSAYTMYLRPFSVSVMTMALSRGIDVISGSSPSSSCSSLEASCSASIQVSASTDRLMLSPPRRSGGIEMSKVFTLSPGGLRLGPT
jgi:hypothetical protein